MKHDGQSRCHNADEMLKATEQIYRDIIKEKAKEHGGMAILSYEMGKDPSYIFQTLAKGKVLRLKKVANEIIRMEATK